MEEGKDEGKWNHVLRGGWLLQKARANAFVRSVQPRGITCHPVGFTPSFSLFSSFPSFRVSTVQTSATANSLVSISHLTSITCWSQQRTPLFDRTFILRTIHDTSALTWHLCFQRILHTFACHQALYKKVLKVLALYRRKHHWDQQGVPFDEVTPPVSAECIWCKQQLFAIWEKDNVHREVSLTCSRKSQLYHDLILETVGWFLCKITLFFCLLVLFVRLI